MNSDHELEQWQREWQQDSTTGVDVDALLADTRRRNRREKLVTVFEAIFNLIVIAACLAAVLLQDLQALERTLIVGLAALAGWFCWWVYRQRRRNWLASPADAKALVVLERRRQLSRLCYWRVSLWVTSGLSGVTLLAAAVSHFTGGEDAEIWLTTALAVLAIVVATAVWSIMVRRQVRRRLRQLKAIERLC